VSVALPVPATVVEDLRGARRRHRVAAIHWIDALYQVYVTALALAAGVLALSTVIGDERLDAAAVADLRADGPAVLGVVAALAVAVGLRSGSRGGPLAVEAAEVRHVLLAPVDRGRALRTPARRQLRFQRLIFAKVAYAQHAEAQHSTFFIHPLHHRVVRGLSHRARRIGKEDLQEIAFAVEPDFYFVGHMVAPVFILSVR